MAFGLRKKSKKPLTDFQKHYDPSQGTNWGDDNIPIGGTGHAFFGGYRYIKEGVLKDGKKDYEYYPDIYPDSKIPDYFN